MPRVHVRGTWNGHVQMFEIYTKLPNKEDVLISEYVRSEVWDRSTAREALDMIESLYGIPRRLVRFVHR